MKLAQRCELAVNFVYADANLLAFAKEGLVISCLSRVDVADATSWYGDRFRLNTPGSWAHNQSWTCWCKSGLESLSALSNLPMSLVISISHHI